MSRECGGGRENERLELEFSRGERHIDIFGVRRCRRMKVIREMSAEEVVAREPLKGPGTQND